MVDGPHSAEIRALRDADQADRKFVKPPTQEEAAAVTGRDRERRKRIREFLVADRLVTPEDFDNAALVFQHGDTPDDYLTAHELSIIAVTLGRFNSMPPTAQDRFLRSIGRRQRFGTQFKYGKNQELVMDPVEGEARTAVTDALRADFLLPTLKEWRQHGVNAFGKSMERLVNRLRRRRDPKWLAQMAKRPASLDLKMLAEAGSARGASRVLNLYRQDALATPDDYAHAARVVRRMRDRAGRPDASALMLAHELATVALMRGHAGARRLSAETLDEFLLAVGQPQRYGTLKNAKDTGGAPDAVRARFGLPRTGMTPASATTNGA